MHPDTIERLVVCGRSSRVMPAAQITGVIYAPDDLDPSLRPEAVAVTE